MSDFRDLEEALRAGPPDEPLYRAGELERGLADRAFRHRPAPRPTVRVASPLRAISLAGAAGLAIVVLAASLILMRPSAVGPGGSPGPSTSVSPAPGASTAVSSVPAALVDRWVGPVRVIADLERPPTRATLDLRGASFRFDAGDGQPADLFDSSVVALEPDVLQFTSLRREGGCEPFDIGTYRWALSPEGSRLAVELVDDVCPARAAALPGTWTHTACRAADNDCLGPMESGRYVTTELDADGSGRSGQLSFTVPAGWSNTLDYATNYFLRPTDEYLEDPGYDGNDGVHGIYIWAGTAAASQPDDCAGIEDTDVPRSADAIADRLLAMPGMRATEGEPIELGGLAGRVIDLEIDPSWAGACPWSGGGPFRSLIVHTDLGPEGGVWGADATSKQRVVLVDITPGRVLSIWLDTTAGRFDALAAEAMPIVASMRVEPAGQP